MSSTVQMLGSSRAEAARPLAQEALLGAAVPAELRRRSCRRAPPESTASPPKRGLRLRGRQLRLPGKPPDPRRQRLPRQLRDLRPLSGGPGYQDLRRNERDAADGDRAEFVGAVALPAWDRRVLAGPALSLRWRVEPQFGSSRMAATE